MIPLVKRAIRWALPLSLLLVSLWMSYDNVFSDIDPIRSMAEQSACTVKKCAEEHGLTSTSRNPFGQSFVFTWRDASVAVDCHRDYYVAGTRTCAVAH
jgi:hypothetical protein